MGFSDLFTQLEALLVDIYPEVTFGYGERDISERESPPRIVWVPTTTKHGAPTKQTTNPRSLKTRNRTVVAHCWEVSKSRTPKGDIDAVDDLVHNLLVCLHRVGWGSLGDGGEEWLKPAHSDLGHAVLVTFELASPVPDKTFQQVKIDHVEADTTGSLPGDKKVDWGEP